MDLASIEQIREFARGVLSGQPLALSELARQLGEAGFELGDQPELTVMRAIDGVGEFTEMANGWALSGPLLDGLTLCIVPSAADVADDVLVIQQDAGPLGWMTVDEDLWFLRPDGSRHLLDVWIHDDGWLGPEGWLEGLADRPVGLTYREHTVTLEPLEQRPVPSPAQVAAFRAAFDLASNSDVRYGSFEPLDAELAHAGTTSVWWEALALDRAAFADGPMPCTPDLATAAGLEADGLTIAPAGFNWAELHRWRRRNRLRHIRHLEPVEAERLQTMLDIAADLLQRDPPRSATVVSGEAISTLAKGLLEPVLFRTWLTELSFEQVKPEELLPVAEAALAQVEGPLAAGLAAVAATCHQLVGDDDRRAEELFELSAAFGHYCGLIGAAGYRADRGDASTAQSMFRRAEADLEHAEAAVVELLGEELEDYGGRRPPAVGRNDRCPCGSGKKYKACHLGKEQLPLEERFYWLRSKSRRFLHSSRFAALPDELVATVAAASGQPHRHIRDQLEAHGLIDDIALHEGGAFAEFLHQRSHLLPPDEALLAAQWALTDRSIFEVVNPDPQQFTLRDVRTGDRLVIGNIASEVGARAGMYLLGRPLPIGEAWRAPSGFVAVAAAYVDDLLGALELGNPFELAEALGVVFSPPKIMNSDGDQLLLHTRRWTVGDPAAARRALIAAGLEDLDGELVLQRDTANMQQSVIAVLRFDGPTLEAEINSAERAEEVAEIVATHLPDAVPDSTPRRPQPGGGTGKKGAALALPGLGRSADDLAGGAGFIGPEEIGDHPELADAIAAMIRGHEERWLDEQIPALGGRTPRDAARDPIGRFELTRLLATFPDTDDPTQMSGRRLRAALGL